MKSFHSAIFTLLVLGLFSTTVLAQQGRPRNGNVNRAGSGMGFNQQWDANRPMNRIPNLTDEQREQIQQIHLEARKNGLEVRNQIIEKQAQLRTRTTGSDINSEEASQLIDEISGLRAQLMKQRLQAHIQVRELLTDEQKVVFDARGFFANGPNRDGKNRPCINRR